MPLPIITFFLLIPILIWAFTTFDNLIKLEYESFHEQWIKDKQPVGMFWRPENYRVSFSSGNVSQKYMLVWLFKTPEWVNGSDEASALLKRLRVLVLIWNICVLLWFFVGLRFLG
jgi:predicted membrane protein